MCFLSLGLNYTAPAYQAALIRRLLSSSNSTCPKSNFQLATESCSSPFSVSQEMTPPFTQRPETKEWFQLFPLISHKQLVTTSCLSPKCLLNPISLSISDPNCKTSTFGSPDDCVNPTQIPQSLTASQSDFSTFLQCKSELMIFYLNLLMAFLWSLVKWPHR